MMKSCGRCERPVYPTEELKCLDKTWHKTCFKCQTCGMALNMKTYKGFNKQPYCEAHIPKVKATTVSETPELRRIAENTKLQSQVKYHEDFEKAKGKFTQVADDPETLRIRANTKIISNVAYHGELEKKAMMEQKRSLTGGEDAVTSESPEPQQPSPEYQPPLPPSAYQHTQQQKVHIDPNANQYTPAKTVTSQQKISVGSVPSNQNESPYSARQHSSSTVVYSSQPKEVTTSVTKTVGSISDYDPMNDNYGSLTKAYRGNATQQQPSGYGVSQPQQTQQNRTQGYQPSQQSAQQQLYNNSNSLSGYRQPTAYSTQQTYQPTPQAPQQYSQQPQQYKQNYTPASYQQNQPQGYTQSQSQQYTQSSQQQYQQTSYSQQQVAYQQQPTYQQQPPSYQQQQQYPSYNQAPPQRKPQGQAFRAMYDYDAQDSDEVSFLDGDVIINCTPIDEGWMTGTIKRTGKTGMIPANYVEPIH